MNDFNELVLSAQQGSSVAMNKVINYMYKVLYSKLRRSWQERPGGYAVEDVVQFGMIAVVKAIKTYDGNGYAKSWLWLHATSEITTQTRYLYHIKRKSNINSYSLDKPMDSYEESTLANMIPSDIDAEQEALDKVYTNSFIEGIRGELTKLEFIVMKYMILEFATKDIIKATGFKPKTVDNAKERIKSKTRRYLAVG